MTMADGIQGPGSVNFEGRGKHRNPLALDRLSEAYKHAGVTQQEFYAEPIAAATSYLHSHAQSEGELQAERRAHQTRRRRPS